MPTLDREVDRYAFARALRPFSLVVGLASALLGVQLAWLEGYGDGGRALAVVAAALLLQAGVNLINDHSDRHLLADDDAGNACRRRIRRNFQLGLAGFALAGLLGLWLLLQAGWPLFWLCLLGGLGAYFYTGEPVNYKRRGLGVLLVFWLMGVLMVSGSYLALSGQWSARVALLSVPLSLLVSLLLLANELRDWEQDRARGIQTLTVRIGFRTGQWLFMALLVGAYLGALGLFATGQLPRLWPLLPSLLPVPTLLRLLQGNVAQRRGLPPRSGRLLALFTAGLLVALAL